MQDEPHSATGAPNVIDSQVGKVSRYYKVGNEKLVKYDSLFSTKASVPENQYQTPQFTRVFDEMLIIIHKKFHRKILIFHFNT